MMKTSINAIMLFFAILFMSTGANAQTDSSKSKIQDTYKVVDVMPEFKGGIEKLIEFIQKKLVYPKEARELGISGKVIVSFVVDVKGKIQDVKVIEGVHPLLDEEAIRVVKSMPRWKPGSIKNKKVKVEFKLPLSFTLK